jgi:GTP-binding protein
MPSTKTPLVAICGRPNVGKSTLFNRVTGRQTAIVHTEEGVTRDRTYGRVEWEGRRFRVVDTGGVVEEPTDPITHKMQQQVRAALDEARVVVFVVDGQAELTKVDWEVQQELFRLGKPVVVAANKLDNQRLADANLAEFFALGFGDPVAVSATHNAGVADLLDRICEHVPEAPDAPEDEDETEGPVDDGVTRVAIVGKPNVGKSSFINAILNEDRAIVTEIPGTTRDALDIEFQWQGRDYLLIDTAGLRRKAGISEDLERFSVSRSLRSIRRADVCLLMMDATEGLTEQDKRIADYVREQGAAMVLVWTKWDLIEAKERRLKEIENALDLKAPFLRYVPWLTMSNLTRQRLFRTFEYVDRIAANARRRVTTGQLNRFLESLRANAPAAQHKGGQARILYATQVSVQPTVFVLFVNQKRLFHFSYLRHVENRLRAEYDFEGVPITIELREERKSAPAGRR